MDNVYGAIDSALTRSDRLHFRVLVPKRAVRWFIGSDCSGHDYLVRDERRADWDAWTDISEYDPGSWEPPPYAVQIEGGTLTFADPVYDGMPVTAATSAPSPDDIDENWRAALIDLKPGDEHFTTRVVVDLVAAIAAPGETPRDA